MRHITSSGQQYLKMLPKSCMAKRQETRVLTEALRTSVGVRPKFKYGLCRLLALDYRKVI